MTTNQIKLSNGEELICDIVEWTEDGDLLVRNAMAIDCVGKGRQKYYIFRPWFQYVESSEHFISVSSDHVLGIAEVNKYLKIQYDDAVNDAHVTHEEREEYYLRLRLEQLHETVTSIANADSGGLPSNVIQFPRF